MHKKGSPDDSDHMSRHPASQGNSSFEENMADAYVNFIVQHSIPRSMTLDEIKGATLKDLILMNYATLWNYVSLLTAETLANKDPELKPCIQSAASFTMIKSSDKIAKDTWSHHDT